MDPHIALTVTALQTLVEDPLPETCETILMYDSIKQSLIDNFIFPEIIDDIIFANINVIAARCMDDLTKYSLDEIVTKDILTIFAAVIGSERHCNAIKGDILRYVFSTISTHLDKEKSSFRVSAALLFCIAVSKVKKDSVLSQVLDTLANDIVASIAAAAAYFKEAPVLYQAVMALRRLVKRCPSLSVSKNSTVATQIFEVFCLTFCCHEVTERIDARNSPLTIFHQLFDPLNQLLIFPDAACRRVYDAHFDSLKLHINDLLLLSVIQIDDVRIIRGLRLWSSLVIMLGVELSKLHSERPNLLEELVALIRPLVKAIDSIDAAIRPSTEICTEVFKAWSILSVVAASTYMHGASRLRGGTILTLRRRSVLKVLGKPFSDCLCNLNDIKDAHSLLVASSAISYWQHALWLIISAVETDDDASVKSDIFTEFITPLVIALVRHTNPTLINEGLRIICGLASPFPQSQIDSLSRDNALMRNARLPILPKSCIKLFYFEIVSWIIGFARNLGLSSESVVPLPTSTTAPSYVIDDWESLTNPSRVATCFDRLSFRLLLDFLHVETTKGSISAKFIPILVAKGNIFGEDWADWSLLCFQHLFLREWNMDGNNSVPIRISNDCLNSLNSLRNTDDIGRLRQPMFDILCWQVICSQTLKYSEETRNLSFSITDSGRFAYISDPNEFEDISMLLNFPLGSWIFWGRSVIQTESPSVDMTRAFVGRVFHNWSNFMKIFYSTAKMKTTWSNSCLLLFLKTYEKLISSPTQRQCLHQLEFEVKELSVIISVIDLSIASSRVPEQSIILSSILSCFNILFKHNFGSQGRVVDVDLEMQVCQRIFNSFMNFVSKMESHPDIDLVIKSLVSENNPGFSDWLDSSTRRSQKFSSETFSTEQQGIIITMISELFQTLMSKYAKLKQKNGFGLIELEICSALLVVALTRGNVSIKNSAIEFWESTFGRCKTDLIYPEELGKALAYLSMATNLSLPGMTKLQKQSFIKSSHTMKSCDISSLPEDFGEIPPIISFIHSSPSQVKSFSPNKQNSSTPVRVRRLDFDKSSPSKINSPSKTNSPSRVNISNDDNSDYVRIDPSPKKTMPLTDHQKEALQRKRFLGVALYEEVDLSQLGEDSFVESQPIAFEDIIAAKPTVPSNGILRRSISVDSPSPSIKKQRHVGFLLPVNGPLSSEKYTSPQTPSTGSDVSLPKISSLSAEISKVSTDLSRLLKTVPNDEAEVHRLRNNLMVLHAQLSSLFSSITPSTNAVI